MENDIKIPSKTWTCHYHYRSNDSLRYDTYPLVTNFYYTETLVIINTIRKVIYLPIANSFSFDFIEN